MMDKPDFPDNGVSINMNVSEIVLYQLGQNSDMALPKIAEPQLGFWAEAEPAAGSIHPTMPMTEDNSVSFNLERLPKKLQVELNQLYANQPATHMSYLACNAIYHGDARNLLPEIAPNSVAVSVWSPPYFVGKDYEAYLSFSDWQKLLEEVIRLHFPIIKPGGFLVINIADILCFRDADMPKIQAEAVHRKRSPVTREDVLKAIAENPGLSRYQLADLLGCSEQTIDRRLNGNNIRDGKYEAQTRVKLVGGLVEEWALKAGFYPYDRRIWVKDAAWENSRWASLSYRSVDEFEYIYLFWKPGITKHDRSRLTREEWSDWGSRGVWSFPSVRANDDHEAKFPLELPRRVIRLLTDPGEMILDCFMGSGTTAMAALAEGRQFLGIEIEKKYVDLANHQITTYYQQHAHQSA
jgi:site-specific DNA-methyltransferase (adenine-specific)